MCIPIFLMERSLGLINSYFGVILPMLCSPFGVYFMSVYTKEALSSEILDSGRVDGANEWMIFYRIVIPIIQPGLVTLFLIIFIGTWNNFFLPLIVLSDSKLYPLTLGLYIWAQNMVSPDGALLPLYALIICGSFVCIFPMLILFPILRKYITAGISFGGVKA